VNDICQGAVVGGGAVGAAACVTVFAGTRHARRRQRRSERAL